MYQYDDYDRALVFERVAQFRDQVERFMAGELSEEEFLPLRLQNGLYLQKHAYMLRVAIPYGTLSAEQMRTLASIARDYDRGYGHFTTRQNMQFNWIELARGAGHPRTPGRRSKCMRSRPPATACATSPPKRSPGSRRTK